MSDAAHIVSHLLEDEDDIDPKDFVERTNAEKPLNLRPYTDPVRVLQVVKRWRFYAGQTSVDGIYTIDFYNELPFFPGGVNYTLSWHAMLDLKPNRPGNLVVVYMFRVGENEWEIERLPADTMAQAKGILAADVAKFLVQLRKVVEFTVRTAAGNE